ncbi:MAG TPA: COX15/CtaA family protein, partial [Thermaerobacter sp.]
MADEAQRRRNGDPGPTPAGRGLKQLAAVATVTMFLVVVAGALVTATGSGEGCGRSWPLCGSPVWTVQAVIEFSHRVVSGIAALAVVALAFLAPRRLGGRRDARWLAGVAVFFLFLQAGLGAGVVLWGQADAVLALHFGISLVSFASVALLSLRVWRAGTGSGPAMAAAPGAVAAAGTGGDERETPKPGAGAGNAVPAPLRRWVWALLAYTYLVVYTGAYVRHTGSSLAC